MAVWLVEQMLVDDEALNDWSWKLTVDLEASKAAGEPVIRLGWVGDLAE